MIDGIALLTTFNEGMVDLSSPDRATIAGITVEGPGVSTELQNIITQEAVRIFEKHGLRAFDAPKEAAAIHEAGHTVLGSLLGKRIKRVRIKRHATKEAWLGLTEYYEQPVLDTPAKQLREARFIYAGVAAEMLFDPDFREGSSIDEVAMSQMVAAQAALTLNVDQKAYWDAEVHYAVGNMLYPHKATLMKIAGHLLRDHKLKQPTLNRLLASAMPAKAEATAT